MGVTRIQKINNAGRDHYLLGHKRYVPKRYLKDPIDEMAFLAGYDQQKKHEEEFTADYEAAYNFGKRWFQLGGSKKENPFSAAGLRKQFDEGYKDAYQYKHGRRYGSKR